MERRRRKDEMNKTILKKLADYFTEKGVKLSPETWRDPCMTESVNSAILQLDGTKSTVKKYVDGTSVVEYGFEIRLRTHSISPKEKLEIAEFFGEIEKIALTSPEDFKISEISGMTKAATYEGGDEEFRTGYKVRMKNEE